MHEPAEVPETLILEDLFGTRQVMDFEQQRRYLLMCRKPSKRSILRDVYARRREVFEHRPKEISLAFDGMLRATLLVNAPSSTLNLSLDSKEVPNSIAALNEQEFHFLILSHDDLICSERRVHRLPLSDDRLLEVTVTPETLGPSIQVIYLDPLFSAVTGDIEEGEPRAITAEGRILNFPSWHTDSATDSEFGWRVWRFEKLRNLIPAMIPLLTGAIVLGIGGAIASRRGIHAFCFARRPESHEYAGQIAGHRDNEPCAVS